MQETYSIEGMNCQSCAQKIEQGISAYAENVRVDFLKSLLYVTGAKISFAELKDHVSRLGPYRLLTETAAKKMPFEPKAYYTLALIIGYLAIASIAGMQNVSEWMRHFMGGFFLVFSFFKLLNIEKFADGYAKYDLLALRWKAYGFIYPFCEIALGLAYLFSWHLQLALWMTIILMGFSASGVFLSMKRKQNIRCACLGDLMNVPVSTVTLVEDVAMAVMAIAMLGN